jgi:hypothetical protein
VAALPKDNDTSALNRWSSILPSSNNIYITNDTKHHAHPTGIANGDRNSTNITFLCEIEVPKP